MERPTEILKRYKESDFYERLCIFLQFPDLRDAFEDIELRNPPVEKDCFIFE
jgi:hypothetical protein